jgi:nicotinate phosphoribosyltransferase
MNTLKTIYKENISMLTDLYQLTMAYAAWKAETAAGVAPKIGVFDLYFRLNPFSGGYAVNCGLDSVLDLIENYGFGDDDCEYLASLKGSDGKTLFETEFISYLRNAKLSVDIDAIEEGRIVFANEPLLRVQGPVWQCQLLETPLLNIINFETLVATKAARVKFAAAGDSVFEFGLRRAQGISGGLCASRAAYIGGVDATSNVLAGKVYGIPLKGTHAHSWVMSYDNELEAFMKFAQAMPNNSVFLVDTYDTIEGVEHAIKAGLWLKSQGHQMLGIRLDSGDLAYLSIEARKLLDAAGLKDAKIVASNDLDEGLIQNLKIQGARIDSWGVGTKLATAFDQPALGGVFKLVAMKEGAQDWKYRIKISEQIIKTTTPGIHQVRRFKSDGLYVGDMIYDVRHEPNKEQVIVDPADPTRRKEFAPKMTHEDLLKPVVRNGRVTASRASLDEIRLRRKKDLESIHPTTLRFLNPHNYPVGLEASLHEKKSNMILEIRGFKGGQRL